MYATDSADASEASDSAQASEASNASTGRVHRARVLIAGAGIGGLTTALSLHAAGRGDGLVVVDAAERLLPLGAGINLQPHAVRELTELGLGERLAEVSAEPRRLTYADRHGNEIVSHPRGRHAGYAWPQLSVHRGELQRLLLDAVRERLGAETVRTGLALESFEDTGGGGVTALLREGDGATRRWRAEVLVGADGLHSAVRRGLHPGQGAPRWNGIRMWRGVTPAEMPLDGRTMLVAGSYEPARIVVYPLAAGLVNWVAEVRTSPVPGPLEGADWARGGSLADVLPSYAGWRIDGLDVAGLLRRTPSILEYPMVDRDPLEEWGRGRVTLLGDAAHPMLPVGSNGGSQAILDGRVLAWHLAQRPADQDPTPALRAYEENRRGPANAVATACRAMRTDLLLGTIARRAPEGFARIEDVLEADELRMLREGMRQTTDMDVATLNSRHSWSI